MEKTIDIDKILKGKLGTKAKYVPAFLVNWLKRIAHEDQVNAFLWESRDKVGVEWLEECVRYLDMTLEIEGKENLPDPNDGRLYTLKPATQEFRRNAYRNGADCEDDEREREVQCELRPLPRGPRHELAGGLANVCL